MRAITVDLYPNDGLGTVIAGQALTGKVVSLGQLSWEVDDQLTKITPGSLSIKVFDEDGSVWTWIQTQIQTVVSGTNQMFPPWVVLNVGGSQRFLGVVDLASLKRDLKSYAVEFSGQDWSVMLRDQVLEGSSWQRPQPKVISSRVGAGPWTGIRYPFLGLLPSLVIFTGDLTATIQVGDLLQKDGAGAGYKVAKSSTNGGYTHIQLEGFSWGGASSASWTRLAASVGDQPYYTVAATVTGTQDAPIYEIPLDTVDHLTPGDTLERGGKGKVRVDDLDAERKLLISAAPITESFASGDRLTLSADSKSELVQQGALDILRRALAPFDLDTSAWSAPAIAEPAFAWLPWWNPATAENLRGISDAEPSLTALRFIGGGQNWIGTPEAGYAVSSGTTVRNVEWTRQQVEAPTLLMPDESPALTPRDRDRNRGYFTWKTHYPKLLDANWEPVTPADTPVAALYPPKVLAHDYAALRRWQLANPTSWTEERWNGSTWTAPAAVTPSTYSGTWFAASAVPFTTVAATTGPTPLGKALLVLAQNANGTTYELQLHFVGASAVVLSVSSARARGARLVCTPWGVYLFGPGGYGKVAYSGGSLTLTWAQVLDASSCWLQPNTLAALDSGSLWVLARMDWEDPEAQEQKRGSETRLFQLAENPTDPAAVILNGTEGTGVRVMPLPPRICTMFRDPSDATRLVGILGSRLYQVSAKLPTTLERVKVTGLSAGELLEHVCQAINAIAIPRPDGRIRLVARTDAGSSSGVTADQSSVTQSRVSSHFFSVVRVSGVDESVYADARGAWVGGRSLEISGHPMVHTEAMAYALAASYASFFGSKPRLHQEEKWVHSDPDTAPTWEALVPWGKYTVNGGATAWLLTAIKEDLIKGEASVTFLEA